jgi:putative oxidoreductase
MSSFIIRIALAIILIMHSVPGMCDGGVNDFGNLYLNEVGFSPYGLIIAWVIKLSHLITAILLVVNKYIKIISIITILVLIMGIAMIHFEEGWYVVGGGRNGVEFSFLLICSFLAIMFPKGITIKKLSKH